MKRKKQKQTYLTFPASPTHHPRRGPILPAHTAQNPAPLLSLTRSLTGGAHLSGSSPTSRRLLSPLAAPAAGLPRRLPTPLPRLPPPSSLHQGALKPGFTPPPLLSSVSPQSSAPLIALKQLAAAMAINGHCSPGRRPLSPFSPYKAAPRIPAAAPSLSRAFHILSPPPQAPPDLGTRRHAPSSHLH
jgi:hypothetical protein